MTAFSPDGKTIATGSDDNQVYLWNATTGEFIGSLGQPGGWISGLGFSKDGSQLAVGAGDIKPFGEGFRGTLRTFHVASGKLLFERELDDAVTKLSIAPDGKRLAIVAGQVLEGAKDPGITFFEATSGKELGKIKTRTSELAAVAWSADSKTFMTVARENVRQFNSEAGVEFAKTDVPHERVSTRTGGPIVAGVSSAVFLRDSSVLTTASDPPEIYRWDLASGKKAWTIRVAAQGVQKMAVSADQQVVAAVCVLEPFVSYQLRMWGIATQRELLSVDLPPETVYSVAFSPDGRRIATGFEDGTALVWDVSAAWEKLEKQP